MGHSFFGIPVPKGPLPKRSLFFISKVESCTVQSSRHGIIWLGCAFSHFILQTRATRERALLKFGRANGPRSQRVDCEQSATKIQSLKVAAGAADGDRPHSNVWAANPPLSSSACP